MKNILFILSVLTILSACNNEVKQVDTEVKKDTVVAVAEPAPYSAPAPVTTEYKTKTGKIFIVTESHPTGMSLSNISVGFKGGDSLSQMPFNDVDPISKVLVGDLDANGFDEIYIITTAAGSGSYGNIYGVSSNSDKSLSMISIPEVTEADMKKGGNFEGYEGHDEFEIVENSLARRFPIKGEGVTMRAINYKLKPGENSYKLYIKNSTAF
jgi:hypothetical protein